MVWASRAAASHLHFKLYSGKTTVAFCTGCVDCWKKGFSGSPRTFLGHQFTFSCHPLSHILIPGFRDPVMVTLPEMSCTMTVKASVTFTSKMSTCFSRTTSREYNPVKCLMGPSWLLKASPGRSRYGLWPWDRQQHPVCSAYSKSGGHRRFSVRTQLTKKERTYGLCSVTVASQGQLEVNLGRAGFVHCWRGY